MPATPFDRSPAAHAPAREHLVDAGGVILSGLLAEPPGHAEPRALIVAVHGAGVHAGYFHASAAPGLSLLELGSRAGYTVWAPDRPGIGASAGLPNERIALAPQAGILLDALDAFAATRSVGGGVLLVGHSYGLKVAWNMAARARDVPLLGVDGSGSGIRYAFDWSPDGPPAVPRREPGDRGPAWGPADLYPPGTFSRAALPLYTARTLQRSEGGRWPDDFRAFAADIRVPLRLTFAEHEPFWPTDDAHVAELRAALVNAPTLRVEREPGAGHNISLGWVAAEYHQKVLEFASSCLDGQETGAAARPWLPNQPRRPSSGRSTSSP